MRKWIDALMLVFALCATIPAAATPMTGADGPFAPVTDYTLPYRADGLFDFTAIDIGAGITVGFDSQMQNVTLLSLGDILIAGVIDASGISLALETPGQIVLTGSVSANSIWLMAGSILFAENSILLTGGDLGVGTGTTGGGICLSLRGCEPMPPLDRLSGRDVTLSALGIPGMLQLRQGGDILLRVPGAGVFAVPEPATSWLITLLLPMLTLLGRKRT